MREIKSIEYIDNGGNPNGYSDVPIIEHPSQGEGDKWYWDIALLNGETHRIFYPTKIIYIN